VRRMIQFSDVHDFLLLMMSFNHAEQTAHVIVPHAIQVLQQNGYRLVTVAECLGMEPYQSVGQPEQVSRNVCPFFWILTTCVQGNWSC